MPRVEIEASTEPHRTKILIDGWMVPGCYKYALVQAADGVPSLTLWIRPSHVREVQDLPGVTVIAAAPDGHVRQPTTGASPKPL